MDEEGTSHVVNFVFFFFFGLAFPHAPYFFLLQKSSHKLSMQNGAQIHLASAERGALSGRASITA